MDSALDESRWTTELNGDGDTETETDTCLTRAMLVYVVVESGEVQELEVDAQVPVQLLKEAVGMVTGLAPAAFSLVASDILDDGAASLAAVGIGPGTMLQVVEHDVYADDLAFDPSAPSATLPLSAMLDAAPAHPPAGPSSSGAPPPHSPY